MKKWIRHKEDILYGTLEVTIPVATLVWICGGEWKEILVASLIIEVLVLVDWKELWQQRKRKQ